MTYEQLTPLVVRRSEEKGLQGVPIILKFNVLNESKKHSLQKLAGVKIVSKQFGVFI